MASSSRFHIPVGWHDLPQKVRFALDRGFGIEIGAFVDVEGDHARSERERRIATKLRRFRGSSISMHGAFLDLALHSSDSLIARHSRERILGDLKLAGRFGCQKIVFHTGFNPLIPTARYRDRFFSTHVDFWRDAASNSAGLVICLENQWENDPRLLMELMRRIDMPNVRICLDVGHAHAYSDVPAQAWLHKLAPFVVHMHWNDNLGDSDSHLPLGAGSIDWASVLDHTSQLETPVSIVIELNSITAIRESLLFLDELRFEAALSAKAFGSATAFPGTMPLNPIAA